MDDKRFWSMIEDAWQDVDGSAAARKKLAQGELDEDGALKLAERAVNEFIPALRASLDQSPKDELLEFDRILERSCTTSTERRFRNIPTGRTTVSLRPWLHRCRRAGILRRRQQRAIACVDGPRMRRHVLISFHVFATKFGEMPHSGISRDGFEQGRLVRGRGLIAVPIPRGGTATGTTRRRSGRSGGILCLRSEVCVHRCGHSTVSRYPAEGLPVDEIRLRPVTFEQLSAISHSVFVSDAAGRGSPEFLVIRYAGVYRDGSSGKGDALDIIATAEAAMKAWWAPCTILDPRDSSTRGGTR